MQYSYILVDGDKENVEQTLLWFNQFPDYYCAGIAADNNDAINKILELQPHLVFLDLNGNTPPGPSLFIITELHNYINVLPAFIVLADTRDYALDALKSGVFDYLLKPLNAIELRKSLLKFQKRTLWPGYHDSRLVHIPQQPVTEAQNKEEHYKVIQEIQKSEVDIQICIKSYGDYQFVALKDVVYLKADNNTTDFFLQNGKKLTAYKTLKHYENNLPSFFYRIHNSYIVNSNYVSRINTAKLLCYLDDNEVSVSFSKTFKENVDTIIKKIAPEYL